MYCTVADVTGGLDPDNLIKLSSEDDEIDEDIVEACISDADAMIDSYLRKIYPVPLDPVPQIIKKLSVSISLSFLYDKRTVPDDSIKKQYDNAEKLLVRIAKREVDIGYTVPTTASANNTIMFTTKTRMFERETSDVTHEGTDDRYSIIDNY